MPIDLGNGLTVQIIQPATPAIKTMPPAVTPAINTTVPGNAVQILQPVAPIINATPPVGFGGAVVVVPVSGIPGTPGGGAFRWNQTVSATVWTVPHDLGRYPAVATVHSLDLAQSYTEFGVQHLDMNTLRITMDVALAGTALLI